MKRKIEKMNLRKIKDAFGWILILLVVIFLVMLLFVPLQLSVKYINILFGSFLVAVPIYLLFEVYFFVKDIPERKAVSKKEKTKKEKIWMGIEYGILVVVLGFLLLARNGSILKKGCPETIQGNVQAEATVRYFFNPFCPSCWRQEAIVQDVLQEQGRNVRLERYDYRYCKQEWKELGLRTVPGFQFEFSNKTENAGVLSKEEFIAKLNAR